MSVASLRPPLRLARSAALFGGLASVVGLRWLATLDAWTGAVAIGFAFGVGMLVVALASGWRPVPERRSAVAVGAAGGAVLVVLALMTRSSPLPSLAPAVVFAPWVAATILVATAEEVLLRAALFVELDRSLGTFGAVLGTSVVFALMHVPLYGWHVVPLDFGVGLWLAGLRLATGGIVAPATAHALADLATWWL
jgi:membrane protease YdiL (CAAX protease family)